jgi:MYXO-CTERM domain-containing protein
MEHPAPVVRCGMTRLAPLVLVLALVPAAAYADAIDGPPACPPGARGRSSHSGQWCEVAACASDADCADAGGHCRAYRVCTRHASIPPGGLGAFRDPPPPPYEVDLVVGSCEPALACRGDEEPPPPSAGTYVEATPTCREATFCVPDALPGLPLIGAPAPSPAPPPASGAAPPSSAASVSVEQSAHASCSCAASGRGAPAPFVLGLVMACVAIARRRR